MRTRRDATGWVPVARKRDVRVIIGVGLVLTCRTEGTNDVIAVGCSVAVFDNHPNARVSVGVRYMGTNLEKFVV